jgi:hypothetical protein
MQEHGRNQDASKQAKKAAANQQQQQRPHGTTHIATRAKARERPPHQTQAVTGTVCRSEWNGAMEQPGSEDLSEWS